MLGSFAGEAHEGQIDLYFLKCNVSDLFFLAICVKVYIALI